MRSCDWDAKRRAASTQSERARAIVDVFSPMALVSASVVVGTGVISAWLRLGILSALWASNYGRVLLLKLAALSGIVVTGAYNWRRVHPLLGTAAAPGRLRRSGSRSWHLVAGPRSDRRARRTADAIGRDSLVARSDRVRDVNEETTHEPRRTESSRQPGPLPCDLAAPSASSPRRQSTQTRGAHGQRRDALPPHARRCHS